MQKFFNALGKKEEPQITITPQAEKRRIPIRSKEISENPKEEEKIKTFNENSNFEYGKKCTLCDAEFTELKLNLKLQLIDADFRISSIFVF